MPPRTRTVRLVRALATVSLLPLLLSTKPTPLLLALRGEHVSPPAEATLGNWALLVLQPAVVLSVGAMFLLYWLRIWPHPQRTHPPLTVLAAAALMATVHEVVYGTPNNLWLYVAVVAGSVLRPRIAIPAVLLVAAAVALRVQPSAGAAVVASQFTGRVMAPESTAVDGPGLSVQISNAALTVLPLLIAGLGTVVITFLGRVNAQLRAAQTLQIRLAAQEERTRMARDLHDTLGHSLSLMAVKLQVAEHLVKISDTQAADEVAEVRQLTHDALRDVRNTVSGTYQPTVDAQLAGAEIALKAAGIAPEIHDEHGAVADNVEAICGWIIREATTNVIRHSGARSCRIGLDVVDRYIVVSVQDDGTASPTDNGGSGLRGLRERVHATGGTLTAGPSAPGPGFALIARVPVDPDNHG